MRDEINLSHVKTPLYKGDSEEKWRDEGFLSDKCKNGVGNGIGTGDCLAVDKEHKSRTCYDSLLFVVVDDGIHHVHHGFSGTEHGLDVVEPFVALEEIV